MTNEKTKSINKCHEHLDTSIRYRATGCCFLKQELVARLLNTLYEEAYNAGWNDGTPVKEKCDLRCIKDNAEDCTLPEEKAPCVPKKGFYIIPPDDEDAENWQEEFHKWRKETQLLS